jgi:methionyl-tRNA formyltransferase
MKTPNKRDSQGPAALERGSGQSPEFLSARPKTAVFAYSEPGCVCLEELFRAGANVVAVFTHEDDPKENIWFRSVREIALARGVPVRTDAKLGPEAARVLRSLGVELLFSFYYRSMIPKEILELPRRGAYNLHGALLPKYRGRACINWAVLNGETETGATLLVMTERADRGDIVAQKPVPIGPDDTALDVFLKVSEAARAALAESLAAIEAGTAQTTPQDESEATTFGRRRPEDGLIDWTRAPARIHDQIRALTHPFPGAFTFVDGRKLFLWRSRGAASGPSAGGQPDPLDTSVVWLGETPLFLADETGLALTAAPPGVRGAMSLGGLRLLRWQFEGEDERSAENGGRWE